MRACEAKKKGFGLFNCPLCGKSVRARRVLSWPDEDVTHHIDCKCGLSLERMKLGNLIRAWNTRKPRIKRPSPYLAG